MLKAAIGFFASAKALGRVTGVLALSAVELLLQLIDAGFLGNSGILNKSQFAGDVGVLKNSALETAIADGAVAIADALKHQADALKHQAEARKKLAEAIMAENRAFTPRSKSSLLSAVDEVTASADRIRRKGGRITISSVELQAILRVLKDDQRGVRRMPISQPEEFDEAVRSLHKLLKKQAGITPDTKTRAKK